MKKYLGILFLGLLFITQSCQKSVLSEVDINDPTLLIVKINIEEKRKKKRQILVSIRDKTNHPVDFATGKVTINGENAEFAMATVLSTTRGYCYRIPDDEHEFEITIWWNDQDSHTFLVDKAAGFPGFSNQIGWNITKRTNTFTISPAPFRDNKIVVEYDVLK